MNVQTVTLFLDRERGRIDRGYIRVGPSIQGQRDRGARRFGGGPEHQPGAILRQYPMATILPLRDDGPGDRWG